MKISMIAAMTKTRVIGANNSLPWHIPEDLQYFKKMTLGKPIVMGRKTFESAQLNQKPLPKRKNIVLTRAASNFYAAIPNVVVVNNIADAIKECHLPVNMNANASYTQANSNAHANANPNNTNNININGNTNANANINNNTDSSNNSNNSNNKAANSSNIVVDEAMIIGGAVIYKEFLPIADRLYLSIVHADYNGDTYFPEYEHLVWQVTKKEEHGEFTSLILDRVK